ncbi:transcriptional repressor [Marinilongibacter aquaticus]|uniref:Fur family transcriptional regulator n=1 Tax=Marinilongibacter aquaticus TaxID=2975157 RepID=UPI0021BDB5E6|nr:Fur family transcriptional regulator [Marinilongibacter aquaticus]UBM57382.1 transcriptional repressor [Marinilongibacter aquaticus]
MSVSLKQHNLRHTECREEVLNAFLNSRAALSHSDIENTIDDKYDRVTIYRTLKTFLEKGIIHKILDADGGSKYALCKNECSKEDHHHDHVHFKCTQCGNTTCMEQIDIPKIVLPQGYSREEINLLIEGQCPNCRQ